MLEDLVGMPGLGGDDDEMIEVGSDYPYHADLQSSKKTISKSKHNRYANGWKDVNHNSNQIRPGSSTNATIRDKDLVKNKNKQKLILRS